MNDYGEWHCEACIFPHDDCRCVSLPCEWKDCPDKRSKEPRPRLYSDGKYEHKYFHPACADAQKSSV